MKLTSSQKKQIVAAIEKAEKKTSGEIRVHLSYLKIDASPLLEAQKEFVKLKMHETKDRNGILIYINPQARKFALFGDEGIHSKLGQAYWDQLKETLRDNIHHDDLTTGIIKAVMELGSQLALHFPYSHSEDKNELQNDISESE